ncbi:Nramp family divalent metal transporter [Paenibacillus sp. Marseille-Q4541]|uniref:Nramp family divalent metal transporter n=1 Tax=Paenibacillus sp. Marseille-Q4541 TaxID=2831522 RepID=UPI001BA9CB98|nr:Nramp family divalent metal transporter [Paenibacillus sp. Marseille-Q4541]
MNTSKEPKPKSIYSLSGAEQPAGESYTGSLTVPTGASWFRKLLAFTGPGFLVAVGYMDPGNWATDIAGGSQFGYRLLFVILLSNLMAVVLQALSGKLGLVTGKDLAQACRQHFKPSVVVVLWILAELAIAATDLAEVIGSAIALQLLFGIPILYGVIITAVDVLLILLLQNRGVRTLESIVIVLMGTIAVCFSIDLFMAEPSASGIIKGIVPDAEILHNPEMLYIAIGILGATVMPHNLYLHSSLVKSRKIENTVKAKKEAIHFTTIDSTIALTIAMFINGAILVVSAAVFHQAGMFDVADITDAYHLLTPLLGTTVASILFGIALLASGQNSTLTGTLSGQIVMEGFLSIKLPAWLRRLVTRLIAIIPAVIVTVIAGEKGTMDLLILSQVILSLQLPFAVIPLVMFTGNKKLMGEFANKRWLNIISWTIAGIIVVLNVYLLVITIF